MMRGAGAFGSSSCCCCCCCCWPKETLPICGIKFFCGGIPPAAGGVPEPRTSTYRLRAPPARLLLRRNCGAGDVARDGGIDCEPGPAGGAIEAEEGGPNEGGAPIIPLPGATPPLLVEEALLPPPIDGGGALLLGGADGMLALAFASLSAPRMTHFFWTSSK